jgi:hypothetical protein
LENVLLIALDDEFRQATAEPCWQGAFERMLPEIEETLTRAFRRLGAEARQEAVQEGVVDCLVAYARLKRLGRANAASARSLAAFAAKHVRQGRTTACRLNARDLLSRYAQLLKGFRVERLDRYCRDSGEWIEALVEDRRATIADQVATRIDVRQWLASLRFRTRRIARDLAMGWTTGEVAREYHVSAARVSQMRRELFESWRRFQGEAPAPAALFGQGATEIQPDSDFDRPTAEMMAVTRAATFAAGSLS